MPEPSAAFLILFRNSEPRDSGGGRHQPRKVEVALQEKVASHHDLPGSALDYVVRTSASLIVDDAAASNLLLGDDLCADAPPEIRLCLPVTKQAKLVGALYLENNLTPNAFTPQQIARTGIPGVASAISLENAYLYADLLRSEAFLSEGQRISHTGSWSWTLASGKVHWSDEHCRIFGHDPAKEDPPDFQFFLGRLHPEDRSFVEQVMDDAIRDNVGFACDFRIVLPDGLVKYVHGRGPAVATESGEIHEYIGTTIDISEQRAQRRRATADAQADLVHAARHDDHGRTGGLDRPRSEPARDGDRDECGDVPALARKGAAGPGRSAERGPNASSERSPRGEVIRSIRALARKSPPEMAELDMNGVIENVLELIAGRTDRHEVSVEMDLRHGLETTMGDRVQLQQVIMNLIMNGIEAMGGLQRRVLRVRHRS